MKRFATIAILGDACLPRSFAVVSILVLLTTCVFEDDKTYFHPIEPPDGSDAAITLGELNGSTLYAPVVVNMNVAPSGSYITKHASGQHRTHCMS